MKKSLTQKIEIPEGIEANIGVNQITIKGPEGEIEKKLKFNSLEIKQEGKEIIISHEKSTKREKKLMNTLAAHIKNMIEGVKNKFEYKLKICFSHFPITVELKGDEAIIKNFLGEKVPRKAVILKNVEIKINGQEIIISSINKETAGQTAANFEKATRIVGKDRRIFQDGIFITNKGGKEI